MSNNFGAALASILGLVAIVIASACSSGNDKPLDQARIAENQQVLKQCEVDRDSCLGGFVKWQGNPTIFRIGYCDGVSCVLRTEIGLVGLLSTSNLAQFEYLVLPGTTLWDSNNWAYGRQFVRKNPARS